MQINLNPEKKYQLQDVMKKRKRNLDLIESKLRSRTQTHLRRKKNKDDIPKRPEKFVKAHRAAQKSFTSLKQRTIKALSHPSHIPENRLLLVVRIRGIHDISNVQKRLLHKLNLREVNTAVFLPSTPKTLLALKRVENYITYGYPSRKTITQLIYKKLYVNVGGERRQVNTNQMVEQNFGGDIICLEDIVNEVVRMGEEFERIQGFVWPFKLTSSKEVLMSRLRKPFVQGGEWGFREEMINEFVNKMI